MLLYIYIRHILDIHIYTYIMNHIFELGRPEFQKVESGRWDSGQRGHESERT